MAHYYPGIFSTLVLQSKDEYMMTRKHYKMIANAINCVGYFRDMCCYETKAEISKTIAAELAKDNPKFNRDKFLKACGVDE